MDKTCPGCGKEPPQYLNYCNWECAIAAAKAAGGKVHCPNGLPVKCIDRNGDMWEHEHGNDPDYKFPVNIKFIGTDGHERFGWYAPEGFIPATDEEVKAASVENHALIYADDSVAITMYECNYYIWSLTTGEYLGGKYSDKNWKLTEESQTKIIKYVSDNKNGD